MDTKQIPLVVIVGPTASGKSALAMELARKYEGEIICADSRTVYKGMDIGTAKPSEADRAEIKHHLLNIVTPDEHFTAARFKQLALEAIADIGGRGKLPIMVGGTGLYVDGVIFDFAFLPSAPPEERAMLERLSVEELQAKLREQGIPLPVNSRNPRHLIRAIETNGQVPIKKGLRPHTLVLGIDIPKEVLAQRISQRTDAMVAAGLEDEVAQLQQLYGIDAPGLTAVGYREWQNSGSVSDVTEKINRATLQYARRQRTWFKRNRHIHWVKNSAEAEELLKYFLHQIRTK